MPGDLQRIAHQLGVWKFYAGTDSGVFQSTDSGGSWSAVNTGLSTLYVTALVINPTTPSTLYTAKGRATVDRQRPIPTADSHPEAVRDDRARARGASNAVRTHTQLILPSRRCGFADPVASQRAMLHSLPRLGGLHHRYESRPRHALDGGPG